MLHFQEFLGTLPILVYGMVGIFAVILIISLVIKLSGWIFPESKDHQN